MQIVFIIGGIVVIIGFLFSLGAIYIRTLRDELNTLWYNISDKLQYRQDLLPNIIETIRVHVLPEKFENYKGLIQDLITKRHKSALYSSCDSEKIVLEHELSAVIKELMQKGHDEQSIRSNTNFLELQKQINDLNEEIDKTSIEYNKKVRFHNKMIKNPVYVLPSTLLKYKRRSIFEFE